MFDLAILHAISSPRRGQRSAAHNGKNARLSGERQLGYAYHHATHLFAGRTFHFSLVALHLVIDVAAHDEIRGVDLVSLFGAAGVLVALRIKGEIVLLIGKAVEPPADNTPLDTAVAALVREGVPRMDAIKRVAKRRGLSKREVYEQLLRDK